MKILLLGRDGQVGWELQRSLAPLCELIALGRDTAANPQGWCGDLTQVDALAASIRAIRPDVIVNAAAHTAVDRAESEPELAHQINAQGPAVLGAEAQKLGAWVVHYSTDYVFDGSGDIPWREDDATGPQNVYGQSKLAGELALAQYCSRHIILRTSWVYGMRGANFAKTMLRLAATRTTLNVINDQYGIPTGADLLADVTAHIVRQVTATDSTSAHALHAGVYHLAAAGQTTWFEYANFVIQQAIQAQVATKMIATQVNPVASAAFVTAARRPLNSRLNTHKLQSIFKLSLPPWESGVARMLSEINYDYQT
jgi:dTDP-4-dehydrorhamnose reductase